MYNYFKIPVLFSFMVIVTIFVCCDTSTGNCIPTKPCNQIPDYKLKTSDALNYIKDYESYLKDSISVVNANVKNFLLPRCELSEMLLEVGPDADIKAHLAIKPFVDTNGDSTNQIVLIFQDHQDNTLSKWYDFTTPCPNICGN